ncbi:SAM-dependent methyltransferase [Hydrogenophaga sp. PAMC20947]|uniref:SAM-dependent methyltransferase n=1 Tax=Hydrogenophaga sp. PAMC20947 TaxID=2565558 RepID=UPI00109DDE33|nr:SAM-dependent methyltransferase [Hydrogenophaga sp. PAMC20947]QCB44715.1 ribosomal RNA small subunit methyltransferase I [Hydrogenophaga sp. PAMC20947]
MKPGTPAIGTLFLIPTPLDFGCLLPDATPDPISRWLPSDTLTTASRLTHWITENAKSTRAFLKRVDSLHSLAAPLQAQNITELPRQVHKKGDHTPATAGDAEARALLAPLLMGHDIGLVSEAGMPAIADPGSSIVRAAHAMGAPVHPMTGPISLMLALAASGLNGQNFAFVGYVPQSVDERAKRLRELETLSLKTGQTQILIETPYRNAALLSSLIQSLHPHTRLAVSCALSLAAQTTRSALIADWKAHALQQALPLEAPAVFLIGR